jgi:hypothetical protein
MEDALNLTSDNLSLHNGFPNPVTNRLDKAFSLDFNQLIIKHPYSTFLFRVAGHQYSDLGIHDQDIVVVDRSLTIKPSSLMIVWLDNSFKIVPSNNLMSNVSEWGIITKIIRSLE